MNPTNSLLFKLQLLSLGIVQLLFASICHADPLVLEPAPKKHNVLLICIDDLRPELKCFGVDYIQSPHIDNLAEHGVRFHRHYVQAPTCGASRFTLLTGRYGGASNGALFERARKLQKNTDEVPASMPAWFRQQGYTTVSVGKVSHHPGGRGGKDWDDDGQPEMPNSWDRHLLPAGDWQHPRGWMHGLAHGEIRKSAKDMDVFQATAGDDSIYPDGVSVPVAIQQLKSLANDEEPFFLACGILRPHLPFGAPESYYELYHETKLPSIPHPAKPKGKTTWHGSGEFMKYNRWGRNPNQDPEFAELVRKHYAACVSYADAQVGRLMAELDRTGARENTIVVLWGDHGWHLGEHAIWGKHALFEESLRSPLIVATPKTARRDAVVQDIVESLDVFPTLCELAGIPTPDFCQGESLAPWIEEGGKGREAASGQISDGGHAISYAGKGKTIRTDRYRLIEHKDGFLELYDHEEDPGETKNLAAEMDGLASELRTKLHARLSK